MKSARKQEQLSEVPTVKTGCVKMMEAVTAILGLFCVGIFVAHAVDAYLMP
jgi:hypothetical protein